MKAPGVAAAELRLERLYYEAQVERGRPLRSRLSFLIMTGLLRLLRRAEVRLEHVLNVETTCSERDRSGVSLEG